MNDAVLTKKHELLEQILFAPSPILESLELNLRTRDVISLAGVCQRWRGYLVPGYRDMESKGGVEKIHYDQSHISWHPLLRTIRPCTQTSLQRRHIICKMGLRCWPPLPQGYHNTSVKDSQNRKPKMINPARLVAIFGDRYFSTAITRIHLDGLTKRFGDGGNGPLLEWIFQCKNLVEISFRWCSLVDVEELAREFVEDPEGVYERQYRKKWRERWPSEPLDKMTEAIPPKLKRFLFWGAGRIPSMEYEIGKEPSKGQVIRGALFDKWALKECVSRLIERYQTDVEWCENEVHYRGTGECRLRGKWDMRLHEKVKQRCEKFFRYRNPESGGYFRFQYAPVPLYQVPLRVARWNPLHPPILLPVKSSLYQLQRPFMWILPNVGQLSVADVGIVKSMGMRTTTE
ncbi:hypothetical protein TWF103_004651 [Orbilia oligospora]|nr:hypothetical protein TWF103_004651 [Orbilia oligospora]